MMSFFVVILLLSIAITAGLRRYALRRSLLDIPNHRSSHSVPVPRGGGLAIVILMLACVLYAYGSGFISSALFNSVFFGGGLIAIIGWVDDHRDLSARFRAAMQFIAAIWAVYCFGGMPELSIGLADIQLGWFGSLVAVFAVVWLVNLYNFMDGTDGIASVQAITAAAVGVFFFLVGGDKGAALLCLALFAATAGFLIWNWSPASIFMGDVGSSFIGYLFAVFALYGEQTRQVPVLIWVILLSGFVIDATFTLAKRLLNGERWYAAHRSHAYQRFVQMGFTHEQLAMRFLLLNLFLICPLAFWAFEFTEQLLWVFLVTMLLCSILWLVIQRGYDRKQ